MCQSSTVLSLRLSLDRVRFEYEKGILVSLDPRFESR